jgi:hypothetical protein
MYPKGYLRKVIIVINCQLLPSYCKNRPSATTVFHQPADWNFRWCLVGSHILPAAVSVCDYLNFPRTHLSGLSKMCPPICVFTFQQSCKCDKYYPKIILGAELVACAKLKTTTLQAHLTWIFSIFSEDIWKPITYTTENVWRRICKWRKEYSRNLGTLASFFLTES